MWHRYHSHELTTVAITCSGRVQDWLFSLLCLGYTTSRCHCLLTSTLLPQAPEIFLNLMNTGCIANLSVKGRHFIVIYSVHFTVMCFCIICQSWIGGGTQLDTSAGLSKSLISILRSKEPRNESTNNRTFLFVNRTFPQCSLSLHHYTRSMLRWGTRQLKSLTK